ncbi:MAG: hypothetical protein AAF533_14750 [Acidobacteriota bacterium]
MRKPHPTALLALTSALVVGSAVAQPIPTQADIDLAVETLHESARSSDPDIARLNALQAWPVLAAAARAPGAGCNQILWAAECALRATLPIEGRDLIEIGLKNGCPAADLLHLKAWQLEFAPDGTRMGPGAPLDECEATYLRAAELHEQRVPPNVELLASVYGRAAELAAYRGDLRAAETRAWKALSRNPSGPALIPLASVYMRGASPRLGEGTSLEKLATILEPHAMGALIDQRVLELTAMVEADPDDGNALAGMAFHSLIVDEPNHTAIGLRHAEKAVVLAPKNPEIWYLLGMAEQRAGRLPEASGSYRRQAQLHPGTSATVLAVNSLALVDLERNVSDQDHERNLGLIHSVIGQVALEPAIHETRSRVLQALGRKSEACSALSDGLLVATGPQHAEVKATIESRLSDLGC